MRIGIWIMMALLLLGCKRDKELTPEEITPLVGKWHQVAYEKVTETGRKWVEVTDQGIYTTLIFRSDGVPLSLEGDLSR
jgi:hypothetical protein